MKPKPNDDISDLNGSYLIFESLLFALYFTY